MIIIIVVLSLMVVILGFTTFNLLRKNEIYEDLAEGYQKYLSQFSQIIDFSDEKLRALDAKGSFKSDDEVGFFFEEIQKLQSLLNDFNVIEINGDSNPNTK